MTFWGFFDETFLMKVLVFQNFDQKVPKIKQKTEICYKKVQIFIWNNGMIHQI